MKKFLLNALFVSSLFSGTYDYAYTGLDKKDLNTTQELDQFMYGDFAEIIRFDGLDFSDANLSANAKFKKDVEENFDGIASTIKNYVDDERKVKIKIIGHASQRTDEYNEVAVDSKTYANKIQNKFRFSQNLNETMENSKDFAQKIAADLVDNGIPQDVIYVEYRGSEELGFTDETAESRDLSNRVMVTMYVLEVKKVQPDTDGDGVYDSTDECPETPEGVEVNKVGCPLDTDKDGVYDYKDDCPNTPEGVAVDEHGCPFDTDEDGVLDYKDKCPGTKKGLIVDEDGCPLTRVLHLNYETNSAVIPETTYSQVTEFAEFMKLHVLYSAEIIGHTDSIGSIKHNNDLSMRRANGVKEALIKEGISPDRLKALGKGELEPIDSNKVAEGRANNRRTEVKVFH